MEMSQPLMQQQIAKRRVFIRVSMVCVERISIRSEPPNGLKSVLRFFSGDNLSNRLGPFDADQFVLQAAIEIGQVIGVEPHLLQDGGVQMFDVQRISHGHRAEFDRSGRR